MKSRPYEQDKTPLFFLQLPVTFLSHVVHAVGHSGALLWAIETREASVVVDKEVICRKSKRN